MKKLALLLLWAISSNIANAQQTVTLNGSVTIPATNAPYAQTITLVGLPSGCIPTMDSTTATITITGCPQSLPVTVVVTCSPVNVNPSSTVNCTAKVTNAANTAVQWSSSAGTINSSGTLIVPATAGTVTVTARSAQDNTKSGSAVITVISQATGLKIEAESAQSSMLPGGGSGSISISPTQDTGGGNKIITNVGGQSYDYAVTIPVAGVYTPAVRICNFPGATGTTSVHLEYPIGVNISGPLQILNGTQWTTVAAPSGKTTNFPQGLVTVRLVIDTMATQGVQTNWFSLTPIGGVQPSVKLSWNPSTSPSVLGYNIYRGIGSTSLVRINSALVPGPYVDTTVATGTTYNYVVTTVGDSAVYGTSSESVYSNQVSVTLP